MLPAEGAPFSPSEGVRERYADTAAQTQEARLTPFPWSGDFRPRRASVFLPPPGGRGQKGTGHQGFLSPLATPQLSFEPRLPAVARLKAKESTDFTSVLSFFCVPWLCDCVVCRA